MSVLNKTFTPAEIIKEFYECEVEGMSRECVTTKFSVKTQTTTATMLNAIAKRFGTTRISLVESLLDNSVQELFSGLNESDKLIVAKEADKEATELMLKTGMTWQVSNVLGNFSNECKEWEASLVLKEKLAEYHSEEESK